MVKVSPYSELNRWGDVARQFEGAATGRRPTGTFAPWYRGCRPAIRTGYSGKAVADGFLRGGFGFELRQRSGQPTA